MALANPALNPPVLRAPSRQSAHSRSPSHSPVPRLRDKDPLLRDLSPTTTLRAFTSENVDLSSWDNSALIRSVEEASSTQRALGARAAQACLDIRSWTREVESWEWPGSFEEPQAEAKKLRMSTISYTSLISGNGSSPDEDEKFLGSLPSYTVRHYEQRITEITEQLDEVDVEDLKKYAWAAHDQASPGTLSDYTALLTATVLQTLPYVARLAALLDVWSLRTQILQQVPKFCADLKRARRDLDHGWAALAVSPSSPVSPTSADFSRDTAEDMRSVVEEQVQSLGKRLDSFLDDLEGTQDTVPNAWIDSFEQLEQAYGDWVVQADRKVLENGWQRSMQSKHMRKESSVHDPTTKDQDLGTVRSERTDHAIGGKSEERSGRSPDVKDAPRSRSSKDSLSKSPYRHRYKAIVLPYDGDGQQYPKEGVTGDVAHPPDPESTFAPEAAFNVTPRLPPIPVKPSASTLGSKRSYDSHLSGPELHDGHVVNATPPLPPPTARASASTLSSKASKENSLGRASDSSLHTTPSSSTSGPSLNVKKRAAFLNKGIERNNSLQLTSQTPVRPFEHASNAFTRLFKNFSPEHKRQQPQRDGSHRRLSLSRSLSRKGSRKSLKSMQDDDTPPLPVQLPTQDISIARPKTPEQVNSRPEASRKLSSPFRSPSQGENEDWPLPSPKKRLAEPGSPSKTLRKAKSTPEVRHSKEFGNAFAWMFRDGALRTVEDDQLERPPEKNLGLEPNAMEALTMPSGLGIAGTMLPEGDPLPLDILPVLRNTADPSQGVVDPMAVVVSTQATINTATTKEHELVDRRDTSSVAVPQEHGPSSALHTFASERPPPARRASNPVLLKLQTTELGSNFDDRKRPTVIRRASIASIESHPRSELKSVTISRKNSASSLTSHPGTPRGVRTKSNLLASANDDQTPDSPMSYRNGITFPRPPSQASGPITPAAKRPLSHARKDSAPLSAPVLTEQEAFLSATQNGDVSSLNAVMPKVRSVQPRNSSDEIESVGKIPQPSGAVSLKHAGFVSPLAKLGSTNRDNFDRHVSEVLERVHAPIEFKTRPGAKTPESRASLGGRPTQRKESFGRNGTPLTIAPAEPSPRKSTSSTQPEVKLYHLTQAGREEPIKLFVRLVGEGERVMVRVGGGWADLADYLKQYAEHHGSRTVSNSGLELNAVDAHGNRRVSGNAVAKAAAAFASAGVQVQPAAVSQGTYVADEDKAPDSPVGESSPSSTQFATPSQRSVASPRASRPPTSEGSRPISRQTTVEGSLAGPASGKKSELSESKAKWVEGMIEMAKSQSAEKSKAEKKFGDLGKIGGTRRVIFRSASGTTGSGNSEKQSG